MQLFDVQQQVDAILFEYEVEQNARYNLALKRKQNAQLIERTKQNLENDIKMTVDLGDDEGETPLSRPEEIKKKVALMLNVLDDREKTIIERYYGLTGTESNLEELGEEFGCTKERIRQLRDKALKKLRNESFSLINYL